MKLLLALLLAGCVEPLPLAGRACPCLDGWRCCARANQCVPVENPCPGPLALDVEAARVPILGEHHFSCDEPASFAVEEAEGGAIDESGHYRAPFAREVFHVVATSLLDASRTVRVPVTVGPAALEVFAGQPGALGLADGQGTDARLAVVDQIVSDGNGLFYFTQSGSILVPQPRFSMVRYVSTGAAVGTTQFGGLWLAWKDDKLYVADETSLGQNQGFLGLFVRVGVSGVSAYVEGPEASARFVAITGIAPDGDDGIYVAEKGGAIRRYDIGSRAVSLLAGVHGMKAFADGDASTARFGTLGRIAPDGAGGIYIADEGNRRLRHLSPAGVVSTLAMLDGSEPIYGITKTSAGDLLVTRGHAILRLEGEALVPWSGERTTIGAADGTLSQARYFFPRGLVVAGNLLYVADGGNGTIRVVDGASVSTLAGAPSHAGDADGTLPEARLRGPTALAQSGERIYVGEGFAPGRVRAIESGMVSTHSQGFRVSALAAGSDGKIYVSYDPDHQVSVVAAPGAAPMLLAGSPSKTAGSSDGVGEAASFDEPNGLALAPDGWLYVADSGNGSVRRIDTNTRLVETVVRGLVRPYALALDGDTLFVTESTQVSAVDLLARTSRVIADRNLGLVRPGGVAVGKPGVFVHIIDGRNLLALRISDGASLLLAGDPTQIGFLAGPLPSRLNLPDALLALPGGELLVADFLENTLGILR